MDPADFKSARTVMGLNIKQMAAAMNIHRNTWYKWEVGEQSPPAAVIRLVETLLWLHASGMLDEYRRHFKTDRP